MTTGAEKPEAGEPSPSPETEDYYAAVERYFVSLRGAPLFVTPEDWHLIHQWRETGIPLRVVKNGLDRAFERRKSTRPVRRLSYCRQAVQSAFQQHSEAMAGTGERGEPSEEPSRVEAFLRERASELRGVSETWRPASTDFAAVVERLIDELTTLASVACRPAGWLSVERELERMDEELLAAAEGALGEVRARPCRAEAERSLAEYRSRMPPEVYASALRSSFLKRLRAQFGLPILSLFDR